MVNDNKNRSSQPVEKYNQLIGIASDLNHGEKTIRQLLAELASYLLICRVSSVYKRDGSKIYRNTASELVCVIKVTTHLSAQQLQKTLHSSKEKYEGCEVLLLAYETNIQMLPNLTLPDPYLVQDQVLLRCGSEVWADYLHPILGQTLNEIVSSMRSSEEIEFYSQGSSLL